MEGISLHPSFSFLPLLTDFIPTHICHLHLHSFTSLLSEAKAVYLLRELQTE